MVKKQWFFRLLTTLPAHFSLTWTFQSWASSLIFMSGFISKICIDKQYELKVKYCLVLSIVIMLVLNFKNPGSCNLVWEEKGGENYREELQLSVYLLWSNICCVAKVYSKGKLLLSKHHLVKLLHGKSKEIDRFSFLYNSIYFFPFQFLEEMCRNNRLYRFDGIFWT